MLFAMKVEWPKRDLATRWVVEIEDKTKPYPEPFMALIPCERIEEKNIFSLLNE